MDKGHLGSNYFRIFQLFFFVENQKLDPIQKDGKTHLTETEQKRLIQSKQAQLAKDLEKVKAARMAREHERSLREREKDRLFDFCHNS